MFATPPDGGSSSTVSIQVFQQWDMFDVRGTQIGSLQSNAAWFQFAFLQLATASQGPGYIRIHESHILANAIPSVDSGFYLFSTTTVGNLYLDGNLYAPVQLIPWTTPSPVTKYLTNWGQNQANAGDATFAGQVSYEGQIVGDSPGTVRDGFFYLIFSKALYPQDCVKYPYACIDLTGLTHDATITAGFTETWSQWKVSWNLQNLAFGPCTFRTGSAYPGVQSLCVYKESQLAPTPISMPANKLSNLGEWTASGYKPTVTDTTFATNTLSLTTTTSGTQTITLYNIIYTNTTAVGTVVNESPNNPFNLCDWLPTWMCGVGWFNLPWWVWIIAAVVLLALILRGVAVQPLQWSRVVRNRCNDYL
jgi:hypothetical protein